MDAGCLENTIVRLLRRRPFYGHFLLGMRRDSNSRNDKPAGVTVANGVPSISVCAEIFSGYEAPEQEGILEHLVKHLLHLHPLRRRGRNHHDWDVACDLAINGSFDVLPPGALYPGSYGMADGLSAEEYYDCIVPPMDTGNEDGSGFGSAARDAGGSVGQGELPEHVRELCNAYTIDDHRIWNEADSTPSGLAEEVVRSLARESFRACNGDIPPDIGDAVSWLLAPSPIPWRQVLRQFIATAGRVGRKSSWTREHRRFSHATPGIRKRHQLNLLVGVDTSDSTNIIGIREAFAAELMRIARGRDANITVLYANSRIQRVESFGGTGYVAHRFDGGGFTDLRPVFEYAGRMRPLPAAVIYLTDGIGPVPERMEFPTLWVLTRDGEKPASWGVEMRMGE